MGQRFLAGRAEFLEKEGWDTVIDRRGVRHRWEDVDEVDGPQKGSGTVCGRLLRHPLHSCFIANVLLSIFQDQIESASRDSHVEDPAEALEWSSP